MTNLHEIEIRLRDLIRLDSNIYPLLADGPNWHKICSAMDVVGDTELAIQEYENLNHNDISDGFSYLIVYGILQVLFVQQDAMRHIAEVINLKVDFPKELLEIRELRNTFIGHPSEHHKGGHVLQGFISRSTIGPGGFQYRRTSSNEAEKWGYLNIPDLIKVQSSHIANLMELFVKHLENEELEHRQKFRNIKLSKIFTDSLEACIVKMEEGIKDPSLRASLGKWALDQTIVAVDSFKTMLIDRGIYGAYEFMLKEFEYPFSKISAYFSMQPTHLTDDDIEIFRFYITTKIKYLKDVALEIDNLYESDTIN